MLVGEIEPSPTMRLVAELWLIGQRQILARAANGLSKAKPMQNPAAQFTLRPYEDSDYPALQTALQLAYPGMPSHITETETKLLRAMYPKGQILCLLADQLIGAVLNRIVPRDKFSADFVESDTLVTDTYLTDAATGDSAYSLDFLVVPAFQSLRIGMLLQERLEAQVFADNFRALVGVSRLVNFHRHQHEMNCETYIQKVQNREISDPVLGFHLRNGCQPRAVLPGFNPADKASCGFGVSILLSNPRFNPDLPIYPSRARRSPQL